MPAILRVVEGDIASFVGDAVVNAANNHHRMGTGVAGDLLSRGGGVIPDECNAYIQREGPLEVGSAAITSGGNLSVRYVIHAAAMGDLSPTPQTIRDATQSAMKLARDHNVLSIAFPVLGSGVGGFPFDEAARIMVEEIKVFNATDSEMDSVVLYGFTAEHAAALQRNLL